MKREKNILGHFSLILWAFLVAGCGASFQSGGEVARGRQALFMGNTQTALADFQAAAQTSPNYMYGTELKEGVLSYLGRAQYLTGQLAPAQATLQQALAQNKDDNLARLYLGLTLAKQGDRKTGLANIEAGLKGMQQLLNYVINTFSNSFGSFWDQNSSLRNSIAANLATIAGGNFDWPALISNCETLAMNYEQVEDIATQNQRQFQEMNRP